MSAIGDDSTDGILPNDMLFVASALRDKTAVDAALRGGADPNCRVSGYSPAFAAMSSIRLATSILHEVTATRRLIADRLTRRELHWLGELDASVDILRSLMDAGADANARNPLGDTLLHAAAVSDIYPDCIRVLIDSGADINARNSKGQRPIDVARHYDSRRTARLLLGSGADISGIPRSWIHDTLTTPGDEPGRCR